MLSSSFFDVAIGIAFVFLLLSLIASTVNEIILSFLNLRGTKLLLGLQTLLNDTPTNINGLVEKIYNHGQIFGLFSGNFNPQQPSNLPSYIPAKNFAMALLDVLPAAAAGVPGLPDAPAQPAVDPHAADRAALQAAQQAADQASRLATQLTAQVAAAPPGGVAAAQLAAAKAVAAAQVAALRLAAQKLALHDLTKKVGVPVLSMIQTAGDDLETLKTHAEDWFNSAMDRVSGWYKFHTQKMLLGIGIVLAIALNANTVVIVQQLSRNPTLRESVVAAAQSAVSAQQKAEQGNKTGQGNTADQANKPEQPKNPEPDKKQDPAAPPEQPAKVSPKAGPANNPPAATADPGAGLKKFSQQINEIEGLGIPLGWPSDWSSVVSNPTSYLGWLLTAIAVSLGAPFWFDVLNKFMVVRSTVKPGEKSQLSSEK